MPIKINKPTFIEPAGDKFKSIEEYIGLYTSIFTRSGSQE